ncbi:hypothetical protein Tco_0464701 [Tanacetum coccineum]
MQSPPQNPQKGSSQLEGEHIKKDKGKKAMSSKDAEEVSTESDSDDETHTVLAPCELGIDLDRPLSEQDPLDRLNDLANKKRKHVMTFHTSSKLTKRLNSISSNMKIHPAEEFLRREKVALFKGISNLLGKSTLVGIEVQQLSLKDCT